MIRRVALFAVLAGGLGLPALAPAGAESPGPSPVANGRRCSFASVTDPTIEGGETETGQINGGPMWAAAPAAIITMKCTIQVGAANSTHAGAASCMVESATSVQVAALPPALCSYLSPVGQPVYLCTEIRIGGTTYYWDDTVTNPGPPEAVVGWSVDPGASCNGPPSPWSFFDLTCTTLRLLSPGIPTILDIGPDGDLYVAGIWFIDCEPSDNPLPGPFFPDPILCPLLASLAPGYDVFFVTEEGDLYVNGVWVWDCPEYRNERPAPYRDCGIKNEDPS